MIKGMVSIVVPVYNVSKYLNDCFLSIENQTYKNIEVIFINDGSTDNSEQLLKLFCEKHKCARYVNQTNQGLSAVRNTGINLCTGEFVYFLDPDDIIHPQTIEILVNALIDTNTDFVCGDSQFMKENVSYNKIEFEKINKVKTKYIPTNNLVKFLCNTAFVVNWSAQVKIYRLDKIRNNPAYPSLANPNLTLGEDYYFNANYISSCSNAVVVYKKLHYYRLRQGSISFAKQFDRRKLNLLTASEPIFKNPKNYTKHGLKAIKGMKAFQAMWLLHNMNSCKYYNSEDAKNVFTIYQKNLKYLFFNKYYPWYYSLLPLAFFYCLHIRNKSIRKDKNKK